MGEITEKTFRGAALIELLHTATLVHDDVVDDSNYRRGFFSINAIWKNKIAVLVGDYLLSKGLLLSVENEDFDLLKSVSTAVREMSEGELLQIEKARKLDITEEVYFDIITKKTATLISACCAVGFQSVGASAEMVEKARLFGEKVGIAFQIKDDLFDYGDAEIGKPLGIDIKEKKMTLPLIYALQKTDSSTRKHIIQLIKKESDDSNKVREVINFVKSTGGLAYANQKMNEVAEEARAVLATFPASEYRNSLGDLLSYTIERNK
jgi:octaprenyl-diphosphate synthase